MHTVFNLNPNNQLKEPMFFGNNLNLSRFDVQKYPIFEKLSNLMLSFFWRPEEVNITKDKNDFKNLTEAEQHVFTSNLKYQSVLDAVQSRSVALMYLPLVSIPELESVIEIWSFQELIHSRSYTHIIRNIYDDPSEVFDKIMFTPELLARAKAINTVYDDLVNGINEFKNVEDRLDDTARSTLIKSLKKKLIKALFTTYMLEGVRFYLSFVCSFSFAERKQMEGNAKVIRFIAR